MLGLIAFLALGVAAAAIALECLAQSHERRPGVPCGSSTMLADDLVSRATCSGVRAVELVPSDGETIYRAEIDGTILELATTISPAAAMDVAREFATRGAGARFPQRLVAETPAGRVPLTIDLRRNAFGWVVTLRRELAEGRPPPPLAYARPRRRVHRAGAPVVVRPSICW
jgi:hypothetical protein